MEQNSTARSNHKALVKDILSSSVSITSSNVAIEPMETVTSLLKPALVNSTKARVNSQHISRSNSCKTPSPTNQKPMKHIRFDLGNTSKDDSWLSPTPPPKDFKRMGTQRATMLPPRNERCMSTAITQRELEAAFCFGKYF